MRLSALNLHATHICRKLMTISVNNRWRTVQLNKLVCGLCSGHFANKCMSKMSRKNYYQKHHTLLHKYNVQGNAVTIISTNLAIHKNETQPQSAYGYSPD